MTSTLAVTAIQARDEARDQRREAEGLVGFMLGDLKDKLEPIGRLDALDGVGSRVLAYYSKQDTSELSDAALLQRSRALSLMAEVAYLRGNLDGAPAAVSARRWPAPPKRSAAIPNDPQRLFDHAQNVFWIGEIGAAAGRDRAEAEAAYREYKRLADQMVAIEPDNLKWRMEVLYANENLGIALYEQRRFGRGRTAVRRCPPANAVVRSNRSGQHREATGLVQPARLVRRYGERSWSSLDSAIAAREREISYLDQLSARNTDVGLGARMIPAHEGLGILLRRGGTSSGHSRVSCSNRPGQQPARDRAAQQ